MVRPFNARFISTFTPDRLYRVYVEGGEISFIRIGGQAGLAEGVGMQFGLLGALVMRSLKKRSEAKVAEAAAGVDREHPSAHLGDHKHNFRTSAGELQSSSLEPPALIRTHGEHFGRWRLRFRDGKVLHFQLETPAEMRIAYEVLPALGGVHVNNVVQDRRNGRFTKVPAAEITGAGS